MGQSIWFNLAISMANTRCKCITYTFVVIILRFEPAPAQVLLSEDITGSLRKLKVCGVYFFILIKSLLYHIQELKCMFSSTLKRDVAPSQGIALRALRKEV